MSNELSEKFKAFLSLMGLNLLAADFSAINMDIPDEVDTSGEANMQLAIKWCRNHRQGILIPMTTIIRQALDAPNPQEFLQGYQSRHAENFQSTLKRAPYCLVDRFYGAAQMSRDQLMQFHGDLQQLSSL